MRLKVSAKEALLKIDNLIKNGGIIFDDIKNLFLSSDPRAVDGFMTPECSLIRYQDNIFNKSNTHKPKLNAKLQKEVDEINKSQNLKSTKNSILIEDFSKWYLSACDILNDLFLDYSPIFEFKKYNAIYNDSYATEYPLIFTIKILEKKLLLLMKFYEQISKDFKSPLIYLDDKSQIHFYNFMIQLQPDCDQDTLAKFMFQHPIGELLSLESIYCYIYGASVDDYFDNKKTALSKITHAYKGINKKAMESFGFSILRLNGSQLLLTLPNSYIKEL